MKKTILLIAAIFCSLALVAQNNSGGVKGTVVNRAGRVPIAEAVITLSQGTETVAVTRSDAEGRFLVELLPNGTYAMKVEAPGFVPSNVNVTVEGYVKDLIFVSLIAEQVVTDVDDSSFSEFDMDDSGYNDAPTILFGTNDPYNEIVSYGFSSIRFKNRGYTSESQDVYLAGVKMNDAITGYSPYSLWSGLNEAMRLSLIHI